MLCERCQENHSGSYGSGRFCSLKCARSFSTSKKRLAINKAVSLRLKGHKIGGTWTDAARTAALNTRRTPEYKISRVLNTDWSKLSIRSRRIRVLAEQENRCAICGILPVWNDKPIVFHYDHILGKSAGEGRSNVRVICPNCHSQTATYCHLNVSTRGKERQRLGGIKSFKNLMNKRSPD